MSGSKPSEPTHKEKCKIAARGVLKSTALLTLALARQCSGRGGGTLCFGGLGVLEAVMMRMRRLTDGAILKEAARHDHDHCMRQCQEPRLQLQLCASRLLSSVALSSCSQWRGCNSVALSGLAMATMVCPPHPT